MLYNPDMYKHRTVQPDLNTGATIIVEALAGAALEPTDTGFPEPDPENRSTVDIEC